MVSALDKKKMIKLSVLETYAWGEVSDYAPVSRSHCLCWRTVKRVVHFILCCFFFQTEILIYCIEIIFKNLKKHIFNHFKFLWYWLIFLSLISFEICFMDQKVEDIIVLLRSLFLYRSLNLCKHMPVLEWHFDIKTVKRWFSQHFLI